MQVEWLYSGEPWANAYVVGDILVDAGVLPMAVAPYKDQIETIVLTHCHFDHIATDQGDRAYVRCKSCHPQGRCPGAGR